MKRIQYWCCAATLLLSGGVFIAGCDASKNRNEVAQENARRYLLRELGPDSAYYEEIRWGKPEARRLEFNESNAYRRYRDSLQRIEQRLTSLDDSISRVDKTATPAYTEMAIRRARYQQDLDLYRQRESEFRQEYEQHPEFDGYWLEHEYRVKKNPPIRVKILLGDTVKYTPSGLIYR